MKRSIEPAVERLLRSGLEEAEEALPFARAVVLHLSGAPASGRDQREAASHVIELLHRAGDSGMEEVPVGWDADPEVLASFFQNADLLDSRSPLTPRIARGVMLALERLGAGS